MTRCYFVGEHFRDTLIDEVISDITNERESFPGGNANAKGARINVFARWESRIENRNRARYILISLFPLYLKFLVIHQIVEKSSPFNALQKCVPFWQFKDFTVHWYLTQSQILSFHCPRDL